jgi:hypothetical protein
MYPRYGIAIPYPSPTTRHHGTLYASGFLTGSPTSLHNVHPEIRRQFSRAEFVPPLWPPMAPLSSCAPFRIVVAHAPPGTPFLHHRHAHLPSSSATAHATSPDILPPHRRSWTPATRDPIASPLPHHAWVPFCGRRSRTTVVLQRPLHYPLSITQILGGPNGPCHKLQELAGR